MYILNLHMTGAVNWKTQQSHINEYKKIIGALTLRVVNTFSHNFVTFS